MKKKEKRLISILLSLVLMLSLMPVMSLRVVAATDSYTALIPGAGDNEAVLANKVVHFNGYNWYIIKDESSAVDTGTVTLLAKDPIAVGAFDKNGNNNYKDSNVEIALNDMTKGLGLFANVANAIAPTDLADVNVTGAKLYLLSTGEANVLSTNVLKTDPSFNLNKETWWLRSGSSDAGKAAFVDGIPGVRAYGMQVANIRGIRPALKLNLAAVTFNSETNTFTPGAYINYFPNGSDDETALANKVVKFNGYDWYIIEDNSTAVDVGTVTLFAKGPIGSSKFDDSDNLSNDYGISTVKNVLDNMTKTDGSFANVANAIVGVDLIDVETHVIGAKLWLLSVEEAGELPANVRNSSLNWWLRSPCNEDGWVAYVDGNSGSITYDDYNRVDLTEAVRPALKLNLELVDFASNEFTLKTKYGAGITTLGTRVMAPPSAPEADKPWNGSYVYYGKYDGTNLTKYRVLDKASTDFDGKQSDPTQKRKTLLLDCDSVLYEAKFDEDAVANTGATYANEWAYSDVKAGLNGDDFLNKEGTFTKMEKDSITESTKESEASDDGGGNPVYFSYAKLSGEKVFLLDAKEVTRTTYGYFGHPGTSDLVTNRIKTGSASSWWLRSPDHNNVYADTVGIVSNAGFVEPGIVNSLAVGVSPAFNVSLSSVIFSSLVSGTSGQAGAEYQLTLKDPDLTIAAGAVPVANSNNQYLIPYEITNDTSVSTPTQVSVVVTNGTWSTENGWSEGAAILQYTKLDGLSGTGTFTLDRPITETWGTDYHVYVLAEDENEKKETDYASAPLEIAPTSYLLKYNSGGGSGSMNPMIVGDGEIYEFPECIFTAPQGKTFDHWTMSGVDSNMNVDNEGHPVNGVFALGNTIKIASNCAQDGVITVTAHWKDTTSPKPPSPSPTPSYTYYTVKFEMNGHGEQVSSQTIRSGLKAKEPSDPTEEGYTFGGWYSDEELTKKYDFSTPVTKNTTLYARWEEIRFTVSFDMNGHGSTIAPQSVKQGETAKKPTAPSAEGFTFNGWYTADGTAYDFSTPVTKDITIYAKWEKVVPPVPVYRMYNPNSGEHFYTVSDEERDILISAGWIYESEDGFTGPAASEDTFPVYRLYNPNGNDHHFTLDRGEAIGLKEAGWIYEGVVFYAYDSRNGIPVYRVYNPNSGHHFFTADKGELDFLVTLGWIYEGIAWYAVSDSV